MQNLNIDTLIVNVTVTVEPEQAPEPVEAPAFTLADLLNTQREIAVQQAVEQTKRSVAGLDVARIRRDQMHSKAVERHAKALEYRFRLADKIQQIFGQDAATCYLAGAAQFGTK